MLESLPTDQLIGFTIWAGGALMWIIGYLPLLYAAFQKGSGWGLSSIFCPPIIYLFGMLNWREVEKPMMIISIALVVCLIGSGIVKYSLNYGWNWEMFIPLPIFLDDLTR